MATKERNHFFRLSRYRDQLLDLIRSGTFRVEPAIRRNEVVRLLEDGLQDISISRQRLAWGIPFPGDPEQTVYVWFDALINYLSATGYPAEGYDRLWPADLHVVGKGITRFHCVIWPAMLLSAGLALPREVWAHGYVQWEGTKMSKTAGTAVSLGEAIERHGPDALRYFLLREVGFEADGNFTWERFDERYTADLADGFGNLASRSLAMIGKYRDGIVPASTEPTTLDDAGAPGHRGVCIGDGRAGSSRRSRGGVGAGVHGQPLHPAERAMGTGQTGEGARSSMPCSRRSRAASHALPAGEPIHSREIAAALGVPRPDRGGERCRLGRARAPSGGRACSDQTRDTLSQARNCIDVGLSILKTI